MKIDNNEPIDDLIVQYNKYKKDGIYYESNGLRSRRLFELELYKLS
jgi:hypothetical protein